ncbi:MAG: three-Cys-motif partner protein TcmP [Alphaproteobacteria bacterium]
MTSYNRDGKSGPWAVEKWLVLQRYLKAYAKVFEHQHWVKTYYIDAFAGTGKAQVRIPSDTEAPLLESYIDDPDYEEFRNGSALCALEAEPPFNGYLFIEANSERADRLNEAISQHRFRNKVRIRREDAETALIERIVNNADINWKKSRAVCFIDPFALQVRWQTLDALASTGAIEIIINFPLGMALQRMLPRDPEKVEIHRTKLDEYFGTPDWYDVIYPTETTLFGDDRTKTNASAIVEWYCRRLEQTFGYVSGPRLVTNSRGGHLYHLIWAGPHPKGQEISSHVLSMADVTT